MVVAPETWEPPGLQAGGGNSALGSNRVVDVSTHVLTAAPPPAINQPEVAKPPQGPIRVSAGVQSARLVKKVIPEYPPLARAARISGVVHLIGVIARDGSIRNLQLVSGHPLLSHAALEAVEQWIYRPTLLNGEPVEVIAPIDVYFNLGQ